MPTMVVSDSFTGADANPLPSPWAALGGLSALKRLSNQCCPANYGQNSGMYYNSGTLEDRQYVKAKIGSSFVGCYAGLVIRVKTSTQYYLVWMYDATGTVNGQLYRYNNGFSMLGSAFNDMRIYPGDEIKFTADGSTLKGFIGASERVSRTDATFTSGKAGIAPWPADPNLLKAGMDDWEAGNLADAAGKPYAARCAMLAAISH